MKPCTKCGEFDAVSYHTQCKNCLYATRRAWYQRNKAYKVRERLGVSIDEAEYWYKRSEEPCEVCGQEAFTTHGNKRNAIDHCHTTGKIRGILCQNCNRAMGLLGDDVSRLRKLTQYLEKHNETT